ncbi:MAG: sulfurtransferase [Chloroflexota bacterium]
MIHTTIISTEELAQNLNNPNWAIIDCRFLLNDTAAGRVGYEEAHIPGAVYAHLDEDLSGPIVPGETGRHPLPSIETFGATLGKWGITSDTQVIAYDTSGCVYAGRLWWMLRWMGHDGVAVLDGDFRLWQKEGRPIASGMEERSPVTFAANPQPVMAASVDEMVANLSSQRYQTYDARDEPRYRGEVAGMDPVSGHIPGAISAHFAANLNEDGTFRSPEELRARFSQLLGSANPDKTIWYCGSGVSVHHDLLALEIAGFDRGARAYIGSWSDWINDRGRPVERG